MGDSFLCRYTSYTAKSTRLKVATDPLRILVYIIICVRFTQKEGAVATCSLVNVLMQNDYIPKSNIKHWDRNSFRPVEWS